jgi:hypothetical protein
VQGQGLLQVLPFDVSEHKRIGAFMPFKQILSHVPYVTYGMCISMQAV